MSSEKPIKPVSYDEGAELIRKMMEAHEQSKGAEHLGFEIDPATGEFVRSDKKTQVENETVPVFEPIPKLQEKPKEKKVYKKATIAKPINTKAPKDWLRDWEDKQNK